MNGVSIPNVYYLDEAKEQLMAFTYRIYNQHGVYFITCTIIQWVDVFTRKDYADIIVESLRYCQVNKGLEIFSWVVMSNHIHLIVSCKEGHALSDILRDFKKYTASKIVTSIENNPQESRKSWLLWLLKKDDAITFWQKDNHAEEITSSAFFRTKCDYIHSNPVRAGIVNKEEEYIYSSASSYYGNVGLLELTSFS